VALVHAESGTNLETLSNFFQNGSSSTSTSTGTSSTGIPAATGLGFGGKSRYLVVSDASGRASVWDLKKTARVRTFRIPHPPGTSAFSGAVCTGARIDPNDTFVAAASGWDTDGALRLYRLREGKLAATLRDVRGSSNGAGSVEWEGHGGISTFEFSPLDRSAVSVGTRDGSVLLWDVQAATKADVSGGGSSTSPSKSKMAAIPPIIRLAQRHGGGVTDIAFSPMNKVLLASASFDGTVSFHDTNMCRTIQSFRPPVDENRVSSRSGPSSAVMSVSFASDGVTCAAGTADGRALIYDLRNVSSGPLSTLEFVPGGSNGESLAVSSVLNARFTSLGPVSSPVITSPTVSVERNEEAEAPMAPATSVDHNASSFDNAPTVNKNSGKVSFAPNISRVHGNKDEEEKKSGTEDIPATKYSAASVEPTNDVGTLAEKSLESLESKLSASSTNDGAPSVPTTGTDAAPNVSDGPDLTITKLILRRMIQDEIDDLREEMENSISNVHVDMLRQFQRQSTEMQTMFQQQAQAIQELMEQNRLLREENERLKLPVYGEY
jgi:WD40 repeat protein